MQPMRSVFIAAALAFSSIAPATAGEIAVWYYCGTDQSPEGLIKSLIQSKLVSGRPYEAHDSIEYFQASIGVTAFGFPLIAIEGAELGSKFFHRAPGTGASSRIGLIVQGQQGQVQRALREMGLTFFTTRAVSQSGPAVFVESFEDFLPTGADTRLAYTKVVCYPQW